MDLSLQQSIAETLDALLGRLAASEPGALDALVQATQRDLRRAAHAQKRGSGVVHESLSAAAGVPTPEARADDLLALDQALDGLAQANARAAEVVGLRYFAGLGDAEIAGLLGVDESTVRRDWIKARGWLFQRLGGMPA